MALLLPHSSVPPGKGSVEGSVPSLGKERAFLPLSRPCLPPAWCRVLTSNQSCASVSKLLGREYIAHALHGTAFVLAPTTLRLKGTVSIMSRYGDARKADENLLPLGFRASMPSSYPGSQGQGKLTGEFQC